MTPLQAAEIALRCNPIEAVQALVEIKVKQCQEKPDLPTFEFLEALAKLAPHAFKLEVK